MTELLGKLLGRSRGLSGLELRVLDAVRALLPAPQACQWDEQVRTINKVQRLPDGVEVDFYRMKQGRPSFDEALAFPNREGELLLAIVSIVLDQAPWPSELAARVWCTRGSCSPSSTTAAASTSTRPWTWIRPRHCGSTAGSSVILPPLAEQTLPVVGAMPGEPLGVVASSLSFAA
ncbi:hypothetical protein [Chitinimonas koreensis]|uniref:hypothetical protein n=1 Tax=Chitinimonas koreensis TaxID=356302 RepID=UPI0016549A5C|nr:hypothetical protein [Chitinimonas koreensis]QNM96726.1 hypothetical protein H9L41_23770 [Chitinimonas koreensis]